MNELTTIYFVVSEILGTVGKKGEVFKKYYFSLWWLYIFSISVEIKHFNISIIILIWTFIIFLSLLRPSSGPWPPWELSQMFNFTWFKQKKGPEDVCLVKAKRHWKVFVSYLSINTKNGIQPKNKLFCTQLLFIRIFRLLFSTQWKCKQITTAAIKLNLPKNYNNSGLYSLWTRSLAIQNITYFLGKNYLWVDRLNWMHLTDLF